MDNPAFADLVRKSSDRLRRLKGKPKLTASHDPSDLARADEPPASRYIGETVATMRGLADNPSGLSTSNPMEDDGYRATVRAIADRFCKLKGQPAYPPVELEGVEQRSVAARDVQTLSVEERRRREDGMRRAIASAAIEGGKIDDQTVAMMTRFAAGEIDENEMIANTLSRYGIR